MEGQIFTKGQAVKARTGDGKNGEARFKRGIFSRYSKTGKHAFFIHTNTGKELKRRAEELEADN